MSGSSKFFHHRNFHQIWSRTICNMLTYDSWVSHNLKIFKNDAWLITHDRDEILKKSLHYNFATVMRFYFMQKHLPRRLSSATGNVFTIFYKIFKNSARLRTYVGGSEFLCIYFIFSLLSNKTGQKLIWVSLLIRRFIEYRCQ